MAKNKEIGVNLLDASIVLVVQARAEIERCLQYRIGAWSVAHDALTRAQVREYVKEMRIVNRYIEHIYESGLGYVMPHFKM